MASHLGAARLLNAMGNDGALPGRFFVRLDSRNLIPRNNVLLIGAVCLVGALMFSYSLGGDYSTSARFWLSWASISPLQYVYSDSRRTALCRCWRGQSAL